MTIRQMIDQEIKRQNLNPNKLAELTGLPTSTLYNALNYGHELSESKLDKVFSVLGLEVRRVEPPTNH